MCVNQSRRSSGCGWSGFVLTQLGKRSPEQKKKKTELRTIRYSETGSSRPKTHTSIIAYVCFSPENNSFTPTQTISRRLPQTSLVLLKVSPC